MSRADSDQLKWRRMRFKNNKVWQATDPDGRPLEKNGKVLIKYQLKQDYEYWVNPANLGQIDAPVEARPARVRRQSGAPTKTEKAVPPAAPNTVHIYTDGASSGNPGPSGIGVVLQYGEKTKEISKFIGNTTNNVAELEAIRTALMELKRRNLPVRIYTDSSYAQGVLSLRMEGSEKQGTRRGNPRFAIGTERRDTHKGSRPCRARAKRARRSVGPRRHRVRRSGMPTLMRSEELKKR